MNDRRLLRHLALAIAVKLLLLYGLWWAFIRDHGVQVDARTAATHLVAPPPAEGSEPSPPGVSR